MYPVKHVVDRCRETIRSWHRHGRPSASRRLGWRSGFGRRGPGRNDCRTRRTAEVIVDEGGVDMSRFPHSRPTLRLGGSTGWP